LVSLRTHEELMDAGIVGRLSGSSEHGDENADGASGERG
jgi:hypothetical protein